MLATKEMVMEPHLRLETFSVCVGSLMPAPVSPPARWPANCGSTAFPCRSRARVATIFMLRQARTKAGTSSTAQEPSTPSSVYV